MRESYAVALQELAAANLIRWDEATSEVMIERWFTHNPPMNSKHKIGTERIIATIRSDVLRTPARKHSQRRGHEHIMKSDQRSYILPIPGAKSTAR